MRRHRFRLRVPGLDLVGDVPQRAELLALERAVVGLELRRVLDVGPADDVFALHVSSLVPCSMLSIPGFSDPVSSLTHLAAAVVFAILSGFPDRPRPRRCAAGDFARGVRLFLRAAAVAERGLPPADAGNGGAQRAAAPRPRRDLRAHRRQLHAGPRRSCCASGGSGTCWRGSGSPRSPGSTLKTVYFDTMPPWLGLLMYLGLGWLGLISTIALARRFGVRFILPLVWGALAYTLGAVAEFLGWPVLGRGRRRPARAIPPGGAGRHLVPLGVHSRHCRGAPALHLMGGGSETATGKLVVACSPNR